MPENKKTAAYIGRFNPIHAGHMKVIERMLELYGKDNSLVVIGSSNATQSLRHFFSYEERKSLILKLFPGIRLVGLPDYADDATWLSALGDILKLGGMDASETTFFGGSKEDIRFFEEAGYDSHIINRFEGEHARISATEVRDALMLDKPLDGLVHNDIREDLKKSFKEKWEDFKKK
jgi:bifunctional NMN adenylyltransferase/nudix hydrolase